MSNRYGFSGKVLEYSFLTMLIRILLLFIPICIGVVLMWEIQKYAKEAKSNQAEVVIWWVVFCFVGIVCLAAVWKIIRFPQEFIPTKWSEFDFWVQLWEQKTEALQLLLQMNKRAPELLYFNTFYKALACGVGTAGFGAGLGRAYHHLENRPVHRARKSKKAFDE